MEALHEQQINNTRNLSSDMDFIKISCNWEISNNKQFHEAFTIVTSSQDTEKTNIQDVVSLDTCISLKSAACNSEKCMINIKLTNHQRIFRIAVVSEAYVLEIFKQFEEYDKTAFAELVDEFEGNFVYFAETIISPSAAEASIRFIQRKREEPLLWIYGIRLFLTEPNYVPQDVAADILSPQIINNLLSKLDVSNEGNLTDPLYTNILNLLRCKNIEGNGEKSPENPDNETTVPKSVDITTYIDNKICDMETRLMKRIGEMEERTNQKLDAILKKLEICMSAKDP